MYRQHFGLTHHPFSNEVEPENLFPAVAAKELEVRLAHLLEMRGIGLVTGDSGSGKTCGARRVLAQLHSSLYRVFYVCLSTGNVMDLYKTISWEMGLSVERSRAALFRQIRSEVTRLVAEARCRPVLVIDEAHHLRPDVLEDLRLLTNYKMDAENRLCLLLWPCTKPSPSASSSAITCPPSHAMRSPLTSFTASATPAPSWPSSSRPPTRLSSRPPADSRERSTSSHTTHSTPLPSPAAGPSPPTTSRPLSRRSRR